jgi:hypothetical protein
MASRESSKKSRKFAPLIHGTTLCILECRDIADGLPILVEPPGNSESIRVDGWKLLES